MESEDITTVVFLTDGDDYIRGCEDIVRDMKKKCKGELNNIYNFVSKEKTAFLFAWHRI